MLSKNTHLTLVTLALFISGIYLWNASKSRDSFQANKLGVVNQTRDANKLKTKPAKRKRLPQPNGSHKTEAVQSGNESISSYPKAVIPKTEDAIPGEYLFKFYNDSDRRAFEAYARRNGVRIIGSMSAGNVLRIGIGDRSLLDKLLSNAPVAIDWMPNTYVRVPERKDNKPQTPPNEPYIAFGNKALAWLGIKDNTGWGQGITVAVLDTGINASGSLTGKDIQQFDLISESSHAGIHGTAVASIIAGNDFTGVAPDVNLMSIKVMSDSGTGDAFTLAQGIIKAVDNGAQIINMSLGSKSDNFVVRDAIQYAVKRGVILVAAVGNDAQYGVLYPARYPDVIAVAGVDYQGTHLYFSNRGPAIDLAAPAAGVAVPLESDKTVKFSGTSAATPFVVGAIAEILTRDPNQSLESIRDILTTYSDDSGAPGFDDLIGAGTLDVGRINSRDQSGIYDMAAMTPYVESTKTGGGTINISAQNRGTETIDEAILEVHLQGETEHYHFFNIHPGNTISQPFNIKKPPKEGIELSYSIRPVGISDSTPNNNSMFSIITVNSK